MIEATRGCRSRLALPVLSNALRHRVLHPANGSCKVLHLARDTRFPLRIGFQSFEHSVQHVKCEPCLLGIRNLIAGKLIDRPACKSTAGLSIESVGEYITCPCATLEIRFANADLCANPL